MLLCPFADEFVKEAEVMVDLQDNNLVRLLGVAIQQRPWLCVIEFMKVSTWAEEKSAVLLRKSLIESGCVYVVCTLDGWGLTQRPTV